MDLSEKEIEYLLDLLKGQLLIFRGYSKGELIESLIHKCKMERRKKEIDEIKNPSKRELTEWEKFRRQYNV